MTPEALNIFGHWCYWTEKTDSFIIPLAFSLILIKKNLRTHSPLLFCVPDRVLCVTTDEGLPDERRIVYERIGT